MAQLAAGNAQLLDVRAALSGGVDPNAVIPGKTHLLLYALSHGACAAVVQVRRKKMDGNHMRGSVI